MSFYKNISFGILGRNSDWGCLQKVLRGIWEFPVLIRGLIKDHYSISSSRIRDWVLPLDFQKEALLRVGFGTGCNLTYEYTHGWSLGEGTMRLARDAHLIWELKGV